MSLVFTLLCATYQAKALILYETLDFHINLAREKKTIFDILDKIMKNDLTKKSPEEINDHALASRVDEDKGTQVRDDMSLSTTTNPPKKKNSHPVTHYKMSGTGKNLEHLCINLPGTPM